MSDLDNDELIATRKLHGQDDGLYRETSDKNVASEEEKLMKSLEYELDRIIEKSSKVETATEIVCLRQPIILMFLKLLKEREQDKKRIQELEERQIVGMTVSDKNVAQDIEYLKSNEADALYFRGNPRLKSAVESVLEKIEELEKDNKRKDMFVQMSQEVIENSILKQKVINKIEEIKEDKESKYFDKFLMARDINYVIEILQELLGESK